MLTMFMYCSHILDVGKTMRDSLQLCISDVILKSAAELVASFTDLISDIKSSYNPATS